MPVVMNIKFVESLQTWRIKKKKMSCLVLRETLKIVRKSFWKRDAEIQGPKGKKGLWMLRAVEIYWVFADRKRRFCLSITSLSS
jgi:hypothetical protein